MATSITVYAVTDAEIQMLTNYTISAKSLFIHLRGHDKAYLDGYWRMLGAFLTRDGKVTTLPATAVMKGDIELPHIERGAHAIYADTNVRFTSLLASVTEEELRQYVTKHERTFAGMHNRNDSQAFEQDFWQFFLHLRVTANKARDSHSGLIFIKWEEK